MSTTSPDPIADMLSRIRNAIAVRKPEVYIPHSKIKEAVAKLLSDNGFIDGVAIDKASAGKGLILTLNQPPAPAKITEIMRLSTPGRRQYASVDQLPKVKQGRGIVIVSTPKGLMTGAQAANKNVGGELICKVY